jgi:hypothetical protein
VPIKMFVAYSSVEISNSYIALTILNLKRETKRKEKVGETVRDSIFQVGQTFSCSEGPRTVPTQPSWRRNSYLLMALLRN